MPLESLAFYRDLSLKDRQMLKGFWQAYEKIRKENAQQGFDDLIYDASCLLKAYPQQREKLAGHYHHIIVHEYQDINEVQQYLFESDFRCINKGDGRG